MSGWPCSCDSCVPSRDSCDACRAAPGVLCAPRCSEHPANRAKCPTMAAALVPEPQIEEHW